MFSHAPEYLQRRERAERAAAKRAASALTRRIHQELAQKYAELRRGTGGDAADPAQRRTLTISTGEQPAIPLNIE